MTPYDYALGRRVTKETTNVAGCNGEYHFFHDGDRIIETRNDSGQVLQQQLWGTQFR